MGLGGYRYLFKVLNLYERSNDEHQHFTGFPEPMSYITSLHSTSSKYL